jgi:hypothetical protein
MSAKREHFLLFIIREALIVASPSWRLSWRHPAAAYRLT